MVPSCSHHSSLCAPFKVGRRREEDGSAVRETKFPRSTVAAVQWRDLRHSTGKYRTARSGVRPARLVTRQGWPTPSGKGHVVNAESGLAVPTGSVAATHPWGCCAGKAAHRQYVSKCVFQHSFIYKGQWDPFGLWLSFASP